MEFKLARRIVNDDSSDCQKITLSEIESMVADSNNRGVIIYLDRDNPNKELKKMLTYFKGRSTYLRDLRYGPYDKDLIYELHII